ncbi:hypothetical protein GGR56DRAFT_496321 [Xylariaceae sp. FL0804]|nr:hypothetical protein GGR56DRAFT_496321 [Xylariaceae sp. FL0804]
MPSLDAESPPSHHLMLVFALIPLDCTAYLPFAIPGRHFEVAIMESVLAIPELLEPILFQLDMTSLLLSATRVNKAWNHLISTSPALQEALFFRPVSVDTSAPLSPKGSLDTVTERWLATQPVINPLLVKKFGGYFFDTGDTRDWVDRCDTFHKLPWEENQREYLGASSEVRQALKLRKRDCDRFTRRGASWRGMLLSQPPPMQLGALLQMATFDPFDKPAQRALKALIQPLDSMVSSGVKMGDLYDLVQYHAGHHEQLSMHYRVIWVEQRPDSYTDFLRDQCRELLRQTPIVVELYDYDDPEMKPPLTPHPIREPPDLDAFDSTFRCEDARPPSVHWMQIESLEFHFNRWVFSTGEEPYRTAEHRM